MQTPSLPGFAFVALVAVLLPVPWHVRARNVATIAIVTWLALANITLFVNSIAWDRHYGDLAPVWCDISIRAPQALIYAIPACSLSQMRRLEAVASVRFTSLTRKQRAQRMYIELGLCVAFPLVMLALSYIVQESRYALVEDIGCVFPAYISWPSIIIINVIPSVVSLAALVYSALAVRWFIQRRLDFQKILSANSPSLNTGRYLRLIAFAVIDVLFSIGSNVFALAWVLATIKLSPWKGFAYTHEDFGMISQYPAPSGSEQWEFMVSLYAAPLYSFIFFIFFGFGEEAVKEYQRVWSFLAKPLKFVVPDRTKQGPPSKHPSRQHAALPQMLGSQVIALEGSDIELAVRIPKRDSVFQSSLAPLGSDSGIPITRETMVSHNIV